MGKAYIICREKSYADEEKFCRDRAQSKEMTVTECFRISNAQQLFDALYQFVRDKSADAVIIYNVRVIANKPELLTEIFRVLLECGKTIITCNQGTITPREDAYILLQMIRSLNDDE